MKMTKKILVGAVAALALVVGFTGCDGLTPSGWGHKRFGNKDILKYDNSTYDSGKGTWTINYANTTGAQTRGIDCLITKHNDMSAVLSFESGAETGVIGVVADAVKDSTTKNWNFLNIGVKKVSSGYQYYVSYFGNIVEANLNNENLGASDKITSAPSKADIVAKKTAGNPFEVNCTKCLNVSGVDTYGFVPLSGVTTTDGIAIDVKQITTGANRGGYEINFYKASDVYNKATDTKLNITDSTPVKATITVPGAYLGKDADAQAWCGAYANVYTPKTLKGSLEIVNVTKEGEDF